jgi:hypothetical protein
MLLAAMAAMAGCGGGDSGEGRALAVQACEELAERWSVPLEQRDDGYYERASRYAAAAAASEAGVYTALSSDVDALIASWDNWSVALDEGDMVTLEIELDRVGTFNESLTERCGRVGIAVPASGE